ncbi:MAG: hypothetical protein HY043_20360 [Verrucomicrobia bacterium]|nr:hypothetical protein [Verrucomicrobiota bacterium]
MKSFLILGLAGTFLAAATVSAQNYDIDSFAIDSGGGTSTGNGFTVSGSIRVLAAAPMSGGGYAVSGEFQSLIGGVPPTVAAPAIFDNTGGTENGYEEATANTWLANKFCLGPQTYQLDSVSLLLNSQDFSGAPGPPAAVRLQIYSNDPVSGKPSASTGLIMNLSGLTNPITLLGGQQLVMWTPATPFTLAANTCYWVVLSTDAGYIGEIDSFTMPTGDAAALGRGISGNAGAAWFVFDNESNRKMLIQGTAVPTPPGLSIAGVSISGNALRFSFLALAGQSYIIESRADLVTGAWVTVPGTTITGTGTAAQVTIPNALTQPQQFYRVKQLP